jgi:flavorubredoxin
LYDAKARIYFSGDVGAALLPPEMNGLYVTDFDRHIRHAEGFHRRWMGSNEAKLSWCERVSRLAIDQLCPQHGAIYRGADVQRFINWFAELPVGSGITTAS